MVSRYGIIPISQFQDTAGPMAKTVADCAILLDAMIGYDPHDGITIESLMHKQGIKDSYKKVVKGKKVGLISLSNYKYSLEEINILNDAKQKLEAKGLHIVELEIEMHPMKNFDTLIYEFKHDLNLYLKTVEGHTQMKTLKDIIEFNQKDPERRLKYGQNILEASEATSGIHDPEYIKMRTELVNEAVLFEKLLVENELDALMSTYWLSYAPIYGNPSICVPAKALIDEQPRSIVFVGKRWDDANLISIAHTYEQLTLYRIPPKLES
jgi:amidase